MSQDDLISIDELRRTLTYKRRNFTRFFNAAGKITAYGSQHPSSNAAAEVKATHARLTKAFGELSDVLHELLIRDKKNTKDYEATCLLYTSPSPRDS